MSFATLPNELIIQISERIQPGDLENYGCTNRRIKSIATPFLREHRELRRKYKKLSVNHVSAAHLIYDLSARPWVQHYLKDLEIVSNRGWRTFQNPRNRREAAQVDEMTVRRSSIRDKDIRHLLQRTMLISPDMEDDWIEQIDKGDEDFLFALLLVSLPRLERLIVRLDHARLEQVKETVRAIKRESLQPSRPRALSRLKDVRVLEKEGSDACDLEIFPLLASLPGVQILHGRNLVGMYRECYRDGWLTYPGASPSITHIYLETCGMSVEGLEMLCNRIKSLKSFKYVAHRAGWGLHRVSDLLKNARPTLEELVISTGSGVSRFVGPLRHFTALRHLTVDSEMLIQRGRMQRAVDVLPASTEVATLTGNSLTGPREEEFLADLYRPSFHYPNLRALYVDDSWGKRLIGKDRLQFQREYHTQSSFVWTPRYRRK